MQKIKRKESNGFHFFINLNFHSIIEDASLYDFSTLNYIFIEFTEFTVPYSARQQG